MRHKTTVDRDILGHNRPNKRINRVFCVTTRLRTLELSPMSASGRGRGWAARFPSGFWQYGSPHKGLAHWPGRKDRRQGGAEQRGRLPVGRPCHSQRNGIHSPRVLDGETGPAVAGRAGHGCGSHSPQVCAGADCPTPALAQGNGQNSGGGSIVSRSKSAAPLRSF